MLYTLEMFDTNQDPTDQDGKGTLNADYATRMKNFFAMYNNTDLDYSKGYAKFDLKEELGDCAHFPYGYVSEEEGDAIITDLHEGSWIASLFFIGNIVGCLAGGIVNQVGISHTKPQRCCLLANHF